MTFFIKLNIELSRLEVYFFEKRVDTERKVREKKFSKFK
jgi:hypothetical protein